MIQGVVVGRDFGNQEDRKQEIIKKIDEHDKLYNLVCYTYSVVEDNKIIFNKLGL